MVLHHDENDGDSNACMPLIQSVKPSDWQMPAQHSTGIPSLVD